MAGLRDSAGGFQRKYVDSDTEVSRSDRIGINIKLAPYNGRVGDTLPLFADSDTAIGSCLSLVSAPERVYQILWML